MGLIETIDERIHRALGKLVRLPARAVIKALETGLKVQKVQVKVLHSEVLNGAELFQQYGFTSAPPEDCEAVVVPIGGKSNHAIVIATEDRRYRPTTLERGEAACYTEEGLLLHFKKGKEADFAETVLNKLVEGADTGVAREGDACVADTSTDASFFSWCAAVHSSCELGGSPPATVTGKITSASEKVLADPVS